jgi:glycosyltransferase involved in cell wall biosynthesis
MSQRIALVSVLVPAYNAARYLPELCRSIEAQTYPHYEVIIADDGSNDDTPGVLAPFLQNNRFQFLRWEQNRGAHQALTILCSAARGEYWCAPGADDVLYPGFLEKRVAIMAANPQACLVHGPPELIDEAGRPTKAAAAPVGLPPRLMPPRSLQVLLQHNVINTPSALVRTSVTRQVLPFFHWNWGYTNDWFSWILHAATVFDFLWDAQPQNKYRIHAQSLTELPSKAALRHAEVALAPLCALACAARFSDIAAKEWIRWRKSLYHRWLLRALTLRARGELKADWLLQGAAAFYDNKCARPCLGWEVLKNGPGALNTRRRERQATQRQKFAVSGVAQVDDAVFR